MNNTNILEKLQDLSNSQVDMFNQNESNNNFEYKKVKIGDIFIYMDNDGEGTEVKMYFKLLEHNKELYLIECKEDGSIDTCVNFDNEESLNKSNTKDFELYISNMLHSKIL